MANDFFNYLRQLDSREKQAAEMADSAAMRNYTEWARHFELLKTQFGELHKLFSYIETNVTNWHTKYEVGRDGKRWGALCWKDSGYYFDEYLFRTEPKTKERDLYLIVKFSRSNDYGSGFGDERKLASVNIDVSDKLGGVEKFRRSERFTEQNTSSLLGELDKCVLSVSVGSPGRSGYNAQRGVGYFYTHNLADDCQQIFMQANEGEIDKDELDKIFTPGEYKRQSGNIAALDDNTIIPNSDDRKWRNDK